MKPKNLLLIGYDSNLVLGVLFCLRALGIILPENKTRVLVKKFPNLTITNEKANTPQIRTFLQGQSST